MELTPSQLQALDNGEPVPLVVEGRECVLLGSSMFEKVRSPWDEWDPRAMQRQMAQMMRDDWSDPAMNVYDE